MSDLDAIQLDEKLHFSEPMIQKIIRAELQKLQPQNLVGVSGEQLAKFSGLIEYSELVLIR